MADSSSASSGSDLPELLFEVPASSPDNTRLCEPGTRPPDLPPQARDLIVNEWLSSMLANRLIITDVPETVLKLGRIQGIKSIAITDATESQILERMRGELELFAERTLNAGQALPRFSTPPQAVSAEVAGVIVACRWRKLVRARLAEWGCVREKLPPQALPAFLVELDQLITRHAAQIQHAA